MKPYRLLAAVSAATMMMAGSAKAQTLVYDSTNYGQLVQQVQNQLNQLEQLKQQAANGQTLLTSLNTNSGVNGLATVLSNPLVRSFLPDINAYVSAGQGANLGQLGVLSSSAQAIRSQNRLYTPQAGDTVGADIDAQGDRAARDLAASQAIGTTVQARLTGLQQLQTSLATAGDARAVMDLQARIQAEQAMIANDQMRLQGLAMTQAAEDRLQQQRDRERMEAARDARLALYKGRF